MGIADECVGCGPDVFEATVNTARLAGSKSDLWADLCQTRQSEEQ